MDRCVAVCRWSGHVSLNWSELSLVLPPQTRSRQPGKPRLTSAPSQTASAPERMCDVREAPSQPGPRALS